MSYRTNHSTERAFRTRFILLLSLAPLLAMVVGACTHVLVAVTQQRDFGWNIFGYWLIALVAATLFTMVISWRLRKQFGPWLQLLILDAGGTFLWYWAFAPIYQYMVLNLSVEQTAVNAFAYFWEVPLIGTLACLYSQWRFWSISKYIQTGHTPDPVKLYKHADSLPFKVIMRNSIAATVGFTLGAIQINHFAGLAGIEIAKDITLGFIVSIFVSLYYFLVFYIIIGPVKSKLVTQYKLKNVVKARYHYRVLTIIIIITLGSLLLMTNLYVNNFQKSARETVVSEASRRMYALNSTQDTTIYESLKFGENGTVYVIPATNGIPVESASRTSVQTFQNTSEGWIQDEGSSQKLIGYRTIGDKKIVTVTYLHDFYAPLFSTLRSLAIGALMVILVTVGASLIFVSVLARTLRQLDAAVYRAQQTGEYKSVIETGDEFEAISRSFGHFVQETKRHSQQLKEEHARLEASMNSLTLGMILTDIDGGIISINNTAQKLLFEKAYVPRTLKDLQSSLVHQIPLASHISKSIITKRTDRANNTIFGTKFFDMFVAPISADNKTIIGSITVIQDVTEAHVLQRSRDEFFSIASHELRTPLTAIRGNAQMIKQFNEKVMKKNPDLNDMVDDIYESSVRLIEIVNDFLDVSRLEQGKVVFKMSEFAIDQTIEAVIYDMQASMKMKKLSLTVNKKTLGSLPNVWADESRTKQVLYNLIGNAAKFTEKGGVTIDATAMKTHIKVTISDTGIGIPPKMQRLLFHKFQQAGESILTRDSTRGTGLGLYISKSIVESMSGRIGLDSSIEGKGSTFSFTIPIATDRLKNSVKDEIHEIDPSTGLTK